MKVERKELKQALSKYWEQETSKVSSIDVTLEFDFYRMMLYSYATGYAPENTIKEVSEIIDEIVY